MHGNSKYKEKHEATWQYIIDHVDDIFKLYVDTREDDPDPEWILSSKKFDFISNTYDDLYVIHKCYACHQCNCNCDKCPIISKAGCCKDTASAYSMVLKAIREHDKTEFIKQAKRIRDGWS